MKHQIKLIKPYINFDEISSQAKEIFDTGIFTRGQHVEAFTNELCSYTGAKHAFLTTSATTALTVSLKAIGVKSGDEVAVSDFSWPATCNVVEDLGAIPLFVDVDKDTYNMNPRDLAKRINSSVKAVIFVDALGNPSGIDGIKEITTSYGIPLIQDSACGIGSSSSGCKVGAISDFTCYSFHPRKLVTTGEGGAILTNNEVYAEWLGIKLACGMTQGVSGDIEFVDFGYNYRLSELQALMGRIQLEKLDEITESRNDIAREYAIALEPVGFRSQRVNPEVYHNKQSVVLTVPAGIDRDTLIDYLRARGIESTLGTYCLSNTDYYRKKYKDVQKNAMWLQQNTITLPCYEGVDAGTVIECIMDFVSDVSKT